MANLVEYLVALAFLVLIWFFVFNPGGSFDKAKEAVKNSLSLDVGLPEQRAALPLISPQRQQEINMLEQTIRTLATAENCFSSFSGFAETEDRMSLEIVALEGKTSFLLKSSAGKQNPYSFEVPGIKPCVIAGEAVDNFEQRYLNAPSTTTETMAQQIKYPDGRARLGQEVPPSEAYYQEVSSLKINFQENTIDYGRGAVDFEGHKWLFKADQEHLCFFPTVDGWSDADGLNDDYLVDETQEDSLPYLIQIGKLPQC